MNQTDCDQSPVSEASWCIVVVASVVVYCGLSAVAASPWSPAWPQASVKVVLAAGLGDSVFLAQLSRDARHHHDQAGHAGQSGEL